MKDFCPDERYFDEVFTRAKEALRKSRQRHNEQAREKNKNPSSRQ
jgi:hypothetical protein